MAIYGGLISGTRSSRTRVVAMAMKSADEFTNVMASHSPLKKGHASIPFAKKANHVMEMFGNARIDEYFWLRDDDRKNPEILKHLEAENAYTELVMEDTKELQEQLYEEMKGRIKEDDTSAPLRDGPYFVYTRNLQGMQYEVHCRRLIPGGEGRGFLEEVMQSDNRTSGEQILLDENELASKHEFSMVGSLKVSPDYNRLAYTHDTVGDELYTIHILDIESGKHLGEPIVGATELVEWVDNNAIVYLTQDDAHRAYKTWCHEIYSSPLLDKCIYHEEDEKLYLDICSSGSKEYLFLVSCSKTTSYVLYMKKGDLQRTLQFLTRRVEGVDTMVAHRGAHFFLTKRSAENFNSELFVCPIEDVQATTLLLPHRPNVKIEDVVTAKDHLIIYERENGLQTIIVYDLSGMHNSLTSLPDGHRITFEEPCYTISPEEFQYNSSILRYSYTSLRTPSSIYDYDMSLHKSVLKKREHVMRNFNIDLYETDRIWATATDGTEIPISLVYRKDLVKLDGLDPILLYGYGSYETVCGPDFKINRLSLIDRGFVYAIAHVRGGGEMGRMWYEDGKLLKKKNTFTDFICCTEYLLKHRYGAKEKLCILGRSAGGLLIGAAVTMRPDLFKSAVAEVPFLDVVTTMLDSSIPLTTLEWEEWGNPYEEQYYFYMQSYSPIDNVEQRDYPHLLVTGGLHDTRVAYWEPAKFVAKLRERRTNDNMLLFKCDLGAGHFSKSGRFDKLREVALTYAFILKSLGLLRA